MENTIGNTSSNLESVAMKCRIMTITYRNSEKDQLRSFFDFILTKIKIPLVIWSQRKYNINISVFFYYIR